MISGRKVRVNQLGNLTANGVSPYTGRRHYQSTALRSGLYNSQAAKRKSTRFSRYTGYKLHLCMTTKGVVLSYGFVPANRYDNIIAPSVLHPLKELNLDIAFILGDAAYDSKDVRKSAAYIEAHIITPLNKRNGMRKDSYARVIPLFLETNSGSLLFKLRNKIELLFHLLKDKCLHAWISPVIILIFRQCFLCIISDFHYRFATHS